MNELNDPFEFKCVSLLNCEYREKLDTTINELSDNFGLLCFSKDWRNPVQWAHYADKHRGLCLGFKVGKDTVKINTVKIKYSNNRKNADHIFAEKKELPSNQISTELQKKRKKMIRSIVSTKFSHWRYEKEHRIYLELSTQTEWGTRDAEGKYFYDFSKNLENIKLTEVIIGINSNISTNEVEDALGKLANDVKIFKVRRHDEKFEMERDETDANLNQANPP